MDSTITSNPKTWVDFGFYVFDSVKTYILPVLGGLLAGWVAPSPQSMIRKAKGQ
jgi:hypothetical protein